MVLLEGPLPSGSRPCPPQPPSNRGNCVLIFVFVIVLIFFVLLLHVYVYVSVTLSFAYSLSFYERNQTMYILLQRFCFLFFVFF